VTTNLLLVVVVVVFALGLAVFAFDVGETVEDTGPAVAVTITGADGDGATADCNPTIGATLVRIHHESGTTIPADEARLRGATPTDGGLPLSARCTGVGSRLAAGESFTVAAMPDDTVRLAWRPDDHNVTLAEWRD
jgi:hypothetical protein